MNISIITLFPQSIEAYLQESMMKRALAHGILSVQVIDLRPFGEGPHHKVDDRPFGGGPGMVLKVDPIVHAIAQALGDKDDMMIRDKPISISPYHRTKIILLSPAGKQFTSKLAATYAKKYSHIIFICGRYEGVDARLKKVVRTTFGLTLEEISIGPYVLSGGELPAMVIMEAVARHVPGFLGKEESLEERRLGVGVPMYTRPSVLEINKKTFKVPTVLQSGDHGKIQEWRMEHRK